MGVRFDWGKSLRNENLHLDPAQSIRALIDIGTNSVKLLVAVVEGQSLRPVHEESEQTRLGRGFYETRQLQPEAIQDTLRVVEKFQATARSLGASWIRVLATSAVRDARNPGDLIERVERVTGLRVEVISGDQEAEWVYRGVTSDSSLHGRRLMILDVGGGSTEFVLGEGEHRQFQESFPLGSVRLLEQLRPSDPPTSGELIRCREWVDGFVQDRILPDLQRAIGVSGSPVSLVGTGGAVTIMGRMQFRLESFERELLEGACLRLADVQGLVERVWSVPVEERVRIIGLPKKRADVILTGSVIYEGVMRLLRFDELRISTRGLRFGGMLDPEPAAPAEV